MNKMLQKVASPNGGHPTNESDSLRTTTVPAHIARQSELKAGDRLELGLKVGIDDLQVLVTPYGSERDAPPPHGRENRVWHLLFLALSGLLSYA